MSKFISALIVWYNHTPKPMMSGWSPAVLMTTVPPKEKKPNTIQIGENIERMIEDDPELARQYEEAFQQMHSQGIRITRPYQKH